MEDVIEKVRKLLAHGNGNVSEAEAAVYIEKAHSILEQHNLTIEDISEKDESKFGVDYGHLADDDYYSSPWKETIYAAAAAYSFCSYVRGTREIKARRSGKPKRITVHVIIGRKANAMVARHMAEYLFQVVERLGKETEKKQKRKDPDRARSYAASFKRGCGFRLAQRLRELRLGSMEKSGVPALYSDEGKTAEAYIDAVFGGAKEVPARLSVGKDHEAVLAGIEAADDVSLNQQIQASGPLKEIE